MDWSMVVVAFALAMDAFAVSVSNGIPIVRLRARHMLRFGTYFGIFQGLMTVLGYMLARSFRDQIQALDHWIAFILLSVIGIHMFLESSRHEDDDGETGALSSHRTMVLLAIATSIDAMAVGISFSLIHVELWSSAILIAAVSFLLSGLGVYLGYRIGRLFEKAAERVGGILLVAMGLKILLEHLIQGI